MLLSPPASSHTSTTGPSRTQYFVCHLFTSSSLTNCVSGNFSQQGGQNVGQPGLHSTDTPRDAV